MTFDQWVESAGFTYLAPRMKVEFQECWRAGQEAMRERAADHVERDARLRIPKKIADDIRALPVE